MILSVSVLVTTLPKRILLSIERIMYGCVANPPSGVWPPAAQSQPGAAVLHIQAESITAHYLFIHQ